MQKRTYIGTSGYIYNHWGNGVFYPAFLKKDKWLEFYCKYLYSVELNVSFYRLPSIAAFKGWYKRTPKAFRFAVKGSRFITHVKRLKDPKEPLSLFFGRAKELKEKLSVVLWQLAPQFKLNLERLEEFTAELKKHPSCRHTFEFRHESWFCDDVYKLLKKANMAVCKADWPEYSKDAPVTADFLYVRRHGTAGQLYGGCYSDEQLKEDILFIKRGKKDAYIYFNNDAHGWAVKNAIRIKELL